MWGCFKLCGLLYYSIIASMEYFQLFLFVCVCCVYLVTLSFLKSLSKFLFWKIEYLFKFCLLMGHDIYNFPKKQTNPFVSPPIVGFQMTVIHCFLWILIFLLILVSIQAKIKVLSRPELLITHDHCPDNWILGRFFKSIQIIQITMSLILNQMLLFPS